MVHRTAWDEIDDTPKQERDLGRVRIKKQIQIKAVEKEETIKKLDKLSKKKKRLLLRNLLRRKKEKGRRKEAIQKYRQIVTFVPSPRIQVLKTRQPNEPSYYFKHSDNVPQGDNFIGKFRVK